MKDKHCDCCSCKKDREREAFHNEPIPEKVFIVLQQKKGYFRNNYYKNTLTRSRALDNVFLNLSEAQDMTRIWRDGYILEAKVIENISEREDK